MLDNLTKKNKDKLIKLGLKKINNEINLSWKKIGELFNLEGEQARQIVKSYRYKNKEVSYNQMRKVCDKYNLDIPLNNDEEDDIFGLCARWYMFSRYKHYGTKDKIYYSVLSRDYEWENFHLDINDYDEDDWDDWIIQQYFEKSAVDNGNLQLAYKLGIEEEEPVLCIYKDHKLLGAYVECDIERIKRLIDYDDKLVAEDLDTYKELLKLLNKQQKEFWRIIYANELLKKKLKMAEKYNRQVIIDALNRSKCLNSNSILYN